MILARDVKAESCAFPCVGKGVNGLYRVDSELVVLMFVADGAVEGQYSFYAFRAQQGTVAAFHGVNTALALVEEGAML